VYSKHAERERESDMITTKEVETALINCEIIEKYPDDPRGPSFLCLGFSAKRPIHTVCAIKEEPQELLLITVYDPSMRPEKWTSDFRKRKG
jgi:hypothetical protein